MACVPKWHPEIFPWHAIFTAILFLFNFFCLISMSMLWRICVYVHISDHVHLCISYRCYPIILSVKHFYTNQEWCEGMIGYLSLGAGLAQWLGEYVTLDKIFYNLFVKREVVGIPTCFQIFFFVSILKEAFIRNIIIILCINYMI
jgi:hypothetical protein